MTPAALRALADAADALARIAREAASEGDLAPTRMLKVSEAAAFAAVKRRTLLRAIRRGELVAYGTHRERTVKGADLLAWIESRRFQRRVVPRDGEAPRTDAGDGLVPRRRGSDWFMRPAAFVSRWRSGDTPGQASHERAAR